MEIKFLNPQGDCSADCSAGGDCVLTMVFGNMQPISERYEPAKALERGTLFPDLDKPFLMGACSK